MVPRNSTTPSPNVDLQSPLAVRSFLPSSYELPSSDGERDSLAKLPAFSPRSSVAVLVSLLPSSILALTTRRKLSRAEVVMKASGWEEMGGGLCGTDWDAEVVVMGDGQRWL